jgi:hypothetical protein
MLTENDLHFGSNILKVPNYLLTGTNDPDRSQPDIYIYPNPANQTISIKSVLNSDIHIFNLQGHP